MTSNRQLGCLWGGVVLLLVVLSPFGAQLAGWVPPCPFKTITGLPCPTCGTTRAALALGRFDVLHALTYHPLPTLGWTLFLAGGFYAGLCALRNRPVPELPSRLSPMMRWGLIGLFLLGWIFNIVTGV
ncbi:MAG: DUF2752 domain-containing protein [Acidobacteriota bacterium]